MDRKYSEQESDATWSEASSDLALRELMERMERSRDPKRFPAAHAGRGVAKHAHTPFRLHVSVMDEGRVEFPVFVIGLDRPFHTTIKELEERVSEYYEEEMGEKMFGGARIRFKTLEGSLLMPREVVGHVCDTEEHIEVYRGRKEERGALPVAAPVPAAIENGEQVLPGANRSGTADRLIFGPVITQGLMDYEWELKFESLPSLPIKDPNDSALEFMPFDWLGFALSDHLEVYKKANGDPKGQWMWDGWYGLETDQGTQTYGWSSAWPEGGVFTLRIRMKKSLVADKDPIFSMHFVEREVDCAPSLIWPHLVQSLLKKDLHLVLFGLSKHWKVTLNSFNSK